MIGVDASDCLDHGTRVMMMMMMMMMNE